MDTDIWSDKDSEQYILAVMTILMPANYRKIAVESKPIIPPDKFPRLNSQFAYFKFGVKAYEHGG